MTPSTRYWIAVGTMVLGGLAASALVGAAARPALWLGVGAAGVVQGPLGWWLVRSLGTDAFMVAWGIGILTRFAMLAVLGFVLVPTFDVPALPALLAYVAIAMALVVVEAIVAHLGQPRG